MVTSEACLGTERVTAGKKSLLIMTSFPIHLTQGIDHSGLMSNEHEQNAGSKNAGN
jgi:hypothetical protein